jgi:hypothetical protein
MRNSRRFGALWVASPVLGLRLGGKHRSLRAAPEKRSPRGR